MKKTTLIPGLAGLAAIAAVSSFAQVKQPNVVIILADDLGYGDISCNGPNRISTPNIDKLAQTGLNFSDGHCTAATSTPSRYSLITGFYPSRNKNAHILPGDAALIVDTERQNLPKLFQNAGYATGIVGKWHLGLGNGQANWNKKLSPGPNEIGFDYSYLMAATNDRMPNVYIEDGHVVNLDPNDPIEVSYKKNFPGQPTGKENPELLRLHPSVGHSNGINNGIPRIGFQKGGKAAMFIDENMADTFLLKAKTFVKSHKDEPFFLYYALHQPHVPRLPNERFLGKSGLGTRGDAILEADWCVGEFIKTLDELALRENTIIIFSSDNGPVLDDGYKDEAKELNGNHRSSGPFRGGKTSYYEGGTRVPFIINWKKHIKPGKSNALVSQLDFMASFGAFLKQDCIKTDGENMMSTFLGKSKKGRNSLICEGFGDVSYREKNWVYVPARTKGKKTFEPELYDLSRDIEQKKNLASIEPEILKSMAGRYEKIRLETLSEPAK
jgi:arylsulfatase A-like enzyme